MLSTLSETSPLRVTKLPAEQDPVHDESSEDDDSDKESKRISDPQRVASRIMHPETPVANVNATSNRMAVISTPVSNPKKNDIRVVRSTSPPDRPVAIRAVGQKISSFLSHRSTIIVLCGIFIMLILHLINHFILHPT